jgi:hypothetical protein
MMTIGASRYPPQSSCASVMRHTQAPKHQVCDSLWRAFRPGDPSLVGQQVLQEGAAAIVVAGILTLFLKETGSAVRKAH